MEIREFYEMIGSDYSRVLRTLMNDRIAAKYAIRFLEDNSFSRLGVAIDAHNIEDSFQVTHSFKGVAGNLGFYHLEDAISDLCEQLRPRTSEADPVLYAKVVDEYNKVMKCLLEYKNSL